MKMEYINKTEDRWAVRLGIAFIAIFIFGFAFYSASKNIDSLKADINDKQNMLTSVTNELAVTKDELITTQTDLQIEIDKSIALNDEIEHLKAELETLNTTFADLTSEEYELIYIGDFKITHYCNEKYKHICGNGDGLTATGTYVTPGRTIAVDPKVIPYGTQVYIAGYGWRTAEDCGGSVDGNHIDVAVDTHAQASDMGVKHGGVWILVKKST